MLLELGLGSVAAASLMVTAMPAEVLIEQGEIQQLNFDFHVTNSGPGDIDLKAIELSVFDPQGKLILRRDVDGSGAAPAIATVGPDRKVDAGTTGLLFNPFTTFANGIPLVDLRYRLTFANADGHKVDKVVVVKPTPDKPKTSLILPVDGRLWAKHGHDYLSHHRRWNALHPIAKSFGATAIFARYALDLMVVDAEGSERRNNAKRNDDFYGWGAHVLAPGDGIVVAAYDDDPDDDLATGKSAFDPARLPREPLHFYGNYVIIDHGQGAYSVLGHLMRDSVAVKPGDRVATGQRVGRIGTSGSAEFQPHLHYELRRGPEMSAEGLPAYFTNFTRAGSKGVVASGPVNAGEIVSNAKR